MTLLSLSAYAKTHGVTQQAVTKWRKSGALVMDGKKVVAEASDEELRGAGLGRFKKGAPVVKPVVKSVVKPVSGPVAAPVAADVDAAEEEEGASLEERLLAGNVLTKVQAERVKESALALKHLTAVRKEAGQLLEADAVERVVFEEAQKARDAWLNFPSKVSPLLAADLGIDAGLIAEALTAHVHKQLESLGDPAFDFGAGED